MFIAAVHVYVKPDKVDDFKEMIRANHESSIAEPGCLRFDVAQSRDDPTEFILWECYLDEAARDAHRATPHYLAFKEAMPELMARDRHSDLYEGIYVASEKLGVTSEAVPSFAIGRLPRITFGSGAFGQVPAIVAGHGSRVLLVTGGRSFNESRRRAELEAGLAEAGVTFVGVATVSGEPGPLDVEMPVDEYRGAEVDVVLGVGGGAVLDTAKAIAGLLRTDTSLMDHLEGVGRGVPYPGPALPVVAVPTTAGTGSEATRNAVITERGPDGYKRSFRDEQMVPADAVVDPDLLASAPRSLIAANGLDALTQLLEAYTSRRATPFTDALARAGLVAVRDGLVPWHRDPDGPEAPAARSRMAYAALLSGICLANAGLGAVHGLASPLGAQLPIPHGMACGAVLWQSIRANITALTERAPDSPALPKYADAGRLLADDTSSVPDGTARIRLVDALHDWVEQLDVPGLSSFGMTVEHIPAVVADSPGSSMRTNPVPLTDEELTAILEAAL